MAKHVGQQQSHLTQFLLDETPAFCFEKAVDMIVAITGKSDWSRETADVNQEPVWLRGNPTFAFPTSDLHSIDIAQQNKFELEANFFSLYGTCSPLPDYFTEAIFQEMLHSDNILFILNEQQLRSLIDGSLDIVSTVEQQKSFKAQQERQASDSPKRRQTELTSEQLTKMRRNTSVTKALGEETFEQFQAGNLCFTYALNPVSNQRDFLDLLNHRLLTLLYFSEKKYRPTDICNRAESDLFVNTLFDLAGFPGSRRAAEHTGSSPIHWPRLLPYAGLLMLHRGNAEVISKVLAGYFAKCTGDVSVEQGVETSEILSDDQCWLLGKQHTELNGHCVAGNRITSFTSRVRIWISNLSIDDLFSFLPVKFISDEEKSLPATMQGIHHEALLALVALLLPPTQKAEICLRLAPELSLPLQLTNENEPTSRLGQTSWLGNCLPTNNWVSLTTQ